MFRISSAVFVAAAYALLAPSAFAQQQELPAEAQPIVLRVDQGAVMTSDGGEFVTAATGKVLQIGDRVMISDDASATVFYDDTCKATYAVPGVYAVERRCDKAVAVGGTNPYVVPGIIGGAVLVGAAVASGGGSDNDSPPVSR